MRYYDTQLTPTTGKTYNESSVSRIPETDERVSVWFQSIDKVKYDRAFDGSGLPILIEFALQADGTRFSNYQSVADINGVYQPDTVKIAQQIQEEAIAHYKSLYLGVVQAKLDALDYDSLATVKVWESDATFGAEATRILEWYKAIIAKNYALLTVGVSLTDEEYLTEINAVVF